MAAAAVAEGSRVQSAFRPLGLALGAVGLLVAAGAAALATGIWELDSRMAYNASLQASCQNKLKQMGLAFKMYANERAGELWPSMPAEAGRLMFQPDQIRPGYLTDDEVLICPAPVRELPEELIDDLFYVYTGYVLTSDEDVLAFAEGYDARLAGGGDFTTDLEVNGETIHRMREGVERFLITDINDPGAAYRIQSEIPVMWDWPDNHQQGWGANVLYMDGHVEWQAYPGEFPMTEVAFTTLANLAGYTPPNAWNNNPDTSGYSAYAAACSSKFRNLGLTLKMYANESQGAKWPKLSAESGKLLFDVEDVFPEFANNREFLVCAGRADAPPLPIFGDNHFAYWGYVLANESDVLAFAGAYTTHLSGGGTFEDDLPVPSSYGTTISRLREGIERFVITDISNPGSAVIAQSRLPVMIEWPENHEGQLGGNVLYMDGHVEWQPYPGEFPMTEATINALRGIAQPAPPNPHRPPDTFYLAENDPYDFLVACRGNFTNLYWTNRMFSDESAGHVYPVLSSESGKLMYDEASVYPEYLSNREKLVCPGPVFTPSGSLVNDQHYAYLGYMLMNDSDVQQFATAYTARISGGGDFTTDLPVASSYGPALLRLKSGVTANLTWPPDTPLEEIPLAQDVPVFIEWPGNHEGQSGGHVGYLDGHVEWHDYPGEFPMTEATISALGALAGWSPATAWESRSFTDEDDPFQQALCGRNLKAAWIAFKTYANLSQGERYPKLNAEEGVLAYDDPRFVQFHLFDLRRMNCPGSPQAYRQPVADDHSDVYPGYVVANQEMVEAVAGG
jgi:prepilin-type processing-associated H-X9-DG protein